MLAGVQITECGVPFAKWQEEGQDPGSTIGPYPSDDVILAVAKQLLGM